MYAASNIALEDSPSKISQLRPTDAQIPSVIIRKNTTNSKEDRTGFRNRTIERAPIIPSDKAIFPEITLVIEKVMIGKRIRVSVEENVLTQLCPFNKIENLVNIEKNSRNAIALNLSKFASIVSIKIIGNCSGDLVDC